MKPKTKNSILFYSFVVLVNLFLWHVLIDSIIAIEIITRFILLLISAVGIGAFYVWKFEQRLIDRFEIKDSFQKWNNILGEI